MKKIFQIYLADLKRISTNVVAIVIIMGLGIIPALYAWFILALIDGYDHILVVGEDFLLAIELRDYYGTTSS